MDGHKGKQPNIEPNNELNKYKNQSNPQKQDSINVIFTEQQPVLKTNSAKMSVNVVSSMQENTILITVGGKKTRCLVDRGAQISIASLEFLKKTNINASSLKCADIHEIVGVGNDQYKVLGILEIPITISGIRIHYNFYIFGIS